VLCRAIQHDAEQVHLREHFLGAAQGVALRRPFGHDQQQTIDLRREGQHVVGCEHRRHVEDQDAARLLGIERLHHLEHALRGQHLRRIDDRREVRDHEQPLDIRRVHDVLEAGVALQIVAQALLAVRVAHAEVFGDARPLQVQIDQRHPGARVLRQRDREVDSCERLALAHRHAGDRERVPLIRFQTPQDARTQDLVGAQGSGVLKLRQHQRVVHRRLVQRDRLKALRMRGIDRRRRHASQARLAARRVGRRGMPVRSLGVLPLGVLAHCFFDDAHGRAGPRLNG